MHSSSPSNTFVLLSSTSSLRKSRSNQSTRWNILHRSKYKKVQNGLNSSLSIPQLPWTTWSNKTSCEEESKSGVAQHPFTRRIHRYSKTRYHVHDDVYHTTPKGWARFQKPWWFGHTTCFTVVGNGLYGKRDVVSRKLTTTKHRRYKTENFRSWSLVWLY